MTDHFTKYVQAYVTLNQKATTVAKTLWDRFFVHYGFPEKIISDQGQNFKSKLLEELCLLTQVKKMRTTPYRLEKNGSCEWFDRTLISMLGTLPKEFKAEWTNHVNTMHIIAQGAMQQDLFCITCSMVSTPCCQLM